MKKHIANQDCYSRSSFLRPHTVVLALALLFSACDSGGVGPDDSPSRPVRTLFHTNNENSVTSVVELVNGELIIGGYAEGVVAPADGTLAYPLILHIRSNGEVQKATVFRDLGYGRIEGVVPLGVDLAVLVSSSSLDGVSLNGRGLTLFRVRISGERKETLMEIPEGYSSIPQPLIATRDGNILFVGELSGGPGTDLVKLTPDGSEIWRFGALDTPGIWNAAERATGEVYVLTTPTASGFTMLRVNSAGAETWRRSFPLGDRSINRTSLAATPGGFAILTTGLQTRGSGSPVFVTHYDPEGNTIREDTLDVEADRYSSVLASADDGSMALATNAPWSFDSGNRATITRLNPDGTLRWTQPFEPDAPTAQIQRVLFTSSGRLVCAGFIGPKGLGGFGGEKFDIVVWQFEKE